jgi:hypothetical protein
VSKTSPLEKEHEATKFEAPAAAPDAGEETIKTKRKKVGKKEREVAAAAAAAQPLAEAAASDFSTSTKGGGGEGEESSSGEKVVNAGGGKNKKKRKKVRSKQKNIRKDTRPLSERPTTRPVTPETRAFLGLPDEKVERKLEADKRKQERPVVEMSKRLQPGTVSKFKNLNS